MRLYKTTCMSDGGSLTKVKWDGTQADAATRRKSMKGEGWKAPATEEVDIPTDKQGLLAWLNENVTGE